MERGTAGDTSRVVSDPSGSATALLSRARATHATHNHREALKLYTTAAEKLFEAVRVAAEPDKPRLRARLTEALAAGEALKTAMQSTGSGPASAVPTAQAHASLVSVTAVGPGLSAPEVAVLRDTSNVNGLVFLPWEDRLDATEPVGSSLDAAWSDPAGKLKLAPKQKQYFRHWARPHDLGAPARMFVAIDSSTLQQTVVSDCSFVSSLAISADYERRFGKPIISNRIFPRVANKPVVNPTGKYSIKLCFNGLWRKVEIDDTLPVAADGRLLCSHTEHRGELWVPLIEKAYMKVMGGYDFPGSNSSVDMHALTGWIPERLAVGDCTAEHWRRLGGGMASGDVLVTLSTGPLSEADERRTGLASCHAYAVVAIREVHGHRLVHIKNPWNKGRWNGKWSPGDAASWTPALEAALDYDRRKAAARDDGQFWMELAAIQRFYEVFHMNWNPALLPYRYEHHQRWAQEAGPARDLYNVGENPQFGLELTTAEPAVLWVLLTRHIVDIQDFEHNREYIGCHVFAGGGRVYYPDKPYIRGVKINSPHHLTKLRLDKGSHKFTVVVSQYEKANTIRFTIRAYSSVPFKMTPIPDRYSGQREQRVTGRWDEGTAGGSPNNPVSYHKNPRWVLQLHPDNQHRPRVPLRIQLFAPKEFHAAVDLLGPHGKPMQNSGAYRPGYVVLEVQASPSTSYTLIPSTFDPGQIGRFFFKVVSMVQVDIRPAS